MITQERKTELIEKYGGNASNTGLPEVQIALFTEHINDLQGHLESSRKDYHSRRGLMKLVSKRRKLLNYLHHNDILRYRAIIAALGIRK